MLTLAHLNRALVEAGKCSLPEPATPQATHRERSSAWVRCLAEELRGMVDDPTVRVFHKADRANRVEFGLSELLYDVCVCATDTCPSARGGKTLRYVTRALWLVESEFARDSSEAVKDFNKLVIGAAENKLFVGPRVAPAEEAGYLAALLPVARCSAGNGASNVYLAMIPHPGEWSTPAAAEPSLRRFVRGGWEAI